MEAQTQRPQVTLDVDAVQVPQEVYNALEQACESWPSADQRDRLHDYTRFIYGQAMLLNLALDGVVSITFDKWGEPEFYAVDGSRLSPSVMPFGGRFEQGR